MTKFRTLIILLVSLLAVGCAEVSEKMEFYQQLNSTLEGYKFENIEIQANDGGEFNVTITDSDLGILDLEEQKEIVRNLSDFVSRLNNQGFDFKSGMVKFIDETEIGVIESSTATTFDLDLE